MEPNLLQGDFGQLEHAWVDKTNRKTNQELQGVYVGTHVTPRGRGITVPSPPIP